MLRLARILTTVCLVLPIILCALRTPVHAQSEDTVRELHLSPDRAQKLRKLVTAPEGFGLSIFAAPPINYPAAITATPGGDLFVAVDRNGSLDRERGRGQIFRVRDTDADGRADRYTVFVDSVDSPRGLAYDGATLYVMHPPNLTAYRDTDDDGSADTSRTLVRGLGRSLDFRGADHTTNGMHLGIDGWLYISAGDYGFDEAVGTDGSRIRYHGGAVVRVRPDGTDLEIYATGLRNSYDITIDPYLNGFVRGNTNDGLGWDVRLMHILPLADYGYPDLYKNFAGETMPPLADYGGGSGTGALYVDTPDLPERFQNTLLTVDWGVSQGFYHPLSPAGASFESPASQEPFLQIPQPTDLTIDGRSNLYMSSWYGAAFTYAGPDVGFIVRLTPENAAAPEVPAFSEASSQRLVELLASPREVYRTHAQQELLRRGSTPDVIDAVEDLAESDRSRAVRIAAIFTLKQLQGAAAHEELLALTDDPEMRAYALRALADRRSELVGVPLDPFLEGLEAPSPRVRLEAVNGLVRLNARRVAPAIISLTADPDRAVAEVAVNALVELRATDACLQAAAGSSPDERAGALEALTYMHTTRTVSGLIERWQRAENAEIRSAIVTALGRLYHREAAWNGTDWWGTQPDPRGPYFEPVRWHESSRIEPVLRRALVEASSDRLDSLANNLMKERALPDGSADLIVRAAAANEQLEAGVIEALVGELTVPAEAVDVLETLAGRTPELRIEVLELLAAQETVPAGSADLLMQAALDENLRPGLRERVVEVLYRSSPE